MKLTEFETALQHACELSGLLQTVRIPHACQCGNNAFPAFRDVVRF